MSANSPRPESFWATAPGKVILSGEHAVVYGQPALAAAINLTSKALLRVAPATSADGVVHLHVPTTGWRFSATAAELKHFARLVQDRHGAFLAGDLPLADIFTSAEDLLPAALGYCLIARSLNLPGDIHLQLSTELLLGGGMGSSASLVASMLAGLMTACDSPFSLAELYQLVLATEQWQHGRSSGLDPQVCIYGGVQWYQQSVCQPLNLETPDHLYLVATGRPQSSTGECVEAVRRQQHDAAFWQQFAQLTQGLQAAIEMADGAAIVAHIKHNHRLLQALQIVPDKVAAMLAEAETLGGAGKVCGAGSVAGDAGGLVLLAGLSAAEVASLCDPRGYTYWPLVWQSQGVAYGTN